MIKYTFSKLFGKVSLVLGVGLLLTGSAYATSYETKNLFDNMGRVTKTVLPNGNYSVNTYNALGQVTATSWYTNLNVMYQRTETDYYATSRQPFQEFGPECFDYPSGARDLNNVGCDVTEYSYDDLGRMEFVEDGEGRVTKTVYYADGKTHKIQRAFGTALQQDSATYTYALNGQEATVTDAKGNKTTYEYDGHDRLSKFILPHKTSVGTSDTSDYEEYRYDANGNMLGKKTRANDWVLNAYDALNRQVRKVQQSQGVYSVLGTTCAGNNSNYCYSYDLTGRQTSVEFGTGDHPVEHAYDSAGRLRCTADNGAITGFSVNASDVVTCTVSTSARKLIYNYDAAGNRTRVTWPDNYHADYSYDNMNRVGTVSDTTGTLATYAYDTAGRRATVTYGNNSVVSYTYHADDALDTLSHDIYVGFANDVAWDYGFNKVNQLTSKSISNDLYQWTGVQRDHDYVTNGLNQYTKIRGNSISYDDNGNLTSDGVWHYEYDVENMLINASRPGMSASFLYDPMGRRSAKTAGGATTTFLHDGVEEIADYEGSTLVRRYVHGPGVDEYLVMYTGSGTTNKSYYHANHQGSIVAMSDGSGNATETHAYSPYGMGEGDDTGNPFRYTGRRLDPETGLYYYRARYYSPSIGRFLQTDPIGYGDGLNWYAYVGNDPLNGTDPSGKFLFLVPIIVGIIETVTVTEVAMAGTVVVAGAIYTQQVVNNNSSINNEEKQGPKRRNPNDGTAIQTGTVPVPDDPSTASENENGGNEQPTITVDPEGNIVTPDPTEGTTAERGEEIKPEDEFPTPPPPEEHPLGLIIQAIGNIFGI